MGGTTSKEAQLLEAISKHDTRRLHACFHDSQYSPLHLVVPLSQEYLDRTQNPQEGSDSPVPSPYSEWLGMSPAHIATEQPDTRVLAEIIALVRTVPEGTAQLTGVEGICSEILDLPTASRWGIRDSSGLTPLSRAVRAGHEQAIKLLLDAGANVDERHSMAEGSENDPTLWSHVRYCASNGKSQILQLLLDGGADFLSWSKDGRRAVHHAVQAGHTECAKILIDKDNASIRDKGNSEHERLSPERVSRAVSKYVVRECFIHYPTEPTVEAAVSTSNTIHIESMLDDETITAVLPERHRNVLDALQVAVQDAVRGIAVGGGRVSNSFRSNRDRGANLLHLACSHSRPEVLSYLLSLDEFRCGLEDMNDSGKSPIFMAVRHGSKECLRLLVEAGANVKSKDIENWTLLHEAVKVGDSGTEILQSLIDDLKVDVNAVDDDGWTALHVSARFNSSQAVDVLIKAGCHVNARTEDNETAILIACSQQSSTEVLRRLLANGADVRLHIDQVLTPVVLALSRKDFVQLCLLLDHIKEFDEATRMQIIRVGSQRETGDTLLHACVQEGNLDSISRLLAIGVQPDDKNHAGLAAIHIVCKNGSDAIAEELLKANGDPNLPRADGMTPIHIASDNGHSRVVRVLIKYGSDLNRKLSSSGLYDGFSPLMLAARLGNVKTVSELVEAGADANLQTSDGFTALHLAALNGNTEVCQTLIQSGADYLLEDHTGYLPIHLATRQSQFEVVCAFLEANVPPDCCGRLRLTALHIASFVCDARIIWLLLRCGASVDAVTDDKGTPLHIAAGKEQGRVCMQLLLANGARIDAVDDDEDTSLHNACYKGLFQNARLLLRRGAAPSQPNNKKVTPLHLAAANGSEETIDALLRYGADVHARDYKDRNPYAVASEFNHRKVMLLLFRGMKVALEEIAPTTVHQTDSSVDAEEPVCVICLNPLSDGEKKRTLLCSHSYHDPCILGWLGGEDLFLHDSCPLCLKSIMPEAIPARAPL